jgi:hypothetical protein
MEAVETKIRDLIIGKKGQNLYVEILRLGNGGSVLINRRGLTNRIYNTFPVQLSSLSVTVLKSKLLGPIISFIS